MSKNTMTPSAAVIGAALVGSLSMANLAHSAENPFAAEQLDGGYLMLAEGSCGEGKCGGKSDGEGKCGEGKCGNKDDGEGKCGEGKCGGAS
ncbi:low-complexity protein [Lamprobacter modestohalophilus]|uniref:HvfA family oxazolone/thioamide-modified RiPP metallophore n=1 Tax=Lamprobacter modestohalophilus TaxID=1064514 RepID=UPI002ADEB9A3|nr:low-complexity protein [Lamprobacter modestohalophilus]MEA1050049.1 low-complexity protein [Lamprobacter modestohalophilus]